MLQLRTFDDVTQIEMSSRRSRLVGYAVSAYLVRGVLVDTGFPRIADEVEDLVRERRPRGAFVTHQHEDHAGNAELLARLGVPLGMGGLTRLALTRPGPIELYRRLVWGAPATLAAPAQTLDDESLRLIPTPGHTPDHHVVWDENTETLFSGDLYLGVKVRIAHASERPRQTLASVRQALALGPRRLFCAHRGAVSNPVDALRAKADWMDETIGRIDERIAQGWSDRVIRRQVLGGEQATGYVTTGEYARINFVRAVRAEPVVRVESAVAPR